MVNIVIDRPVPKAPTSTTLIRGSGAEAELGWPLAAAEEEKLLLLQSPEVGFTAVQALDAVFFDREIIELPPVDFGQLQGNQRYFGNSGGTTVVDPVGDNFIFTRGQDDRVLLGLGDDRVFDRGGNNSVTIVAGNNTITMGDGNDLVATGNGNDNINVSDGFNDIEAGDGDNIVRGGDGLDVVTVGYGNDFVEVRGGRGDTFNVPLDFLGLGNRAADNYIFDFGGSDSLRATSGARSNGDDVVLSDAALLVGQPNAFGSDNINVRGGDNIVVDFGGDTVVDTLDGDDVVITSLVETGDDRVRAGAGNDTIDPGGGSDTVYGGPGRDSINLNNDGDADTIGYEPGDISQSVFTADGSLALDLIFGFDGGGIDKIDLSALATPFGVTEDILDTSFFTLVNLDVGSPKIPDLLLQWDADGNDVVDFFTGILVDFPFQPGAGQPQLTADSFMFGIPEREDELVAAEDRDIGGGTVSSALNVDDAMFDTGLVA